MKFIITELFIMTEYKFISACKNGELDIVKIINDVDINFSPLECDTRIMKTCRHGHYSIVKFLIAYDLLVRKKQNMLMSSRKAINFNKSNTHREFPFTIGCEKGYIDILIDN